MMVITAFKDDFDPLHYFEAPGSLLVQTSRAGYLEVPTELASVVENAFVYGCIYNTPRNASRLFERYQMGCGWEHQALTEEFDDFLEKHLYRWIAVEYI